MVHKVNPTKEPELDKFIPRIQEILDDWAKVDTLTVKKLPVEVDVPELLAAAAFVSTDNELIKAVGDLALIAFYYLL